MMPRTTVNVNQELLEAAQRALDTTGVTATVNAALAMVARREALGAFDVASFDVTDADIAEARADRGRP
jgi:Arc/MetJ family transcription regulator